MHASASLTIGRANAEVHYRLNADKCLAKVPESYGEPLRHIRCACISQWQPDLHFLEHQQQHLVAGLSLIEDVKVETWHDALSLC